MKSLFAAFIIAFGVSLGLAQNEQSPIVEKDINYKNWKYKSVSTGAEIDLRNLAAGKKLVVVVYYAPWCPNWKHDAPFLQKFYDKYKSNGLEIVGVGEYDPVASMQTNLDTLKVTFPVVYESESRAEKQNTLHYGYRKSTGDARNWGSPWYIFLDPKLIEKKGDVLVKKTFVINGEMIEPEGEKYIRTHLGLPAEEPKGTAAANSKIEVCDPAAASVLKKP